MDKHVRGMSLQPESVNELDRTVEVIWTTGARVKRVDFEGFFFEELVVSEEAIDLERLRNGAPVLNTHSSYETEDVLGVVEDAWIVDGKGFARLRFSERESVKDIWNDIKSGVLRNLSVGYGVDDVEEVTEEGGDRVLRVTKWTPHEISVVPVPADASSQFRSLETPEVSEIAVEEPDEDPKGDDETASNEDPKVDENNEDNAETSDEDRQRSGATDAGDAASDESDDDASNEDAPSSEDDVQDTPEAPKEVPADVQVRSLAADIVEACVEFGQPEAASEYIRSGLAVDAVRTQLEERSEVKALVRKFGFDEAGFMKKPINEVRKLILDKLVNDDVEVESRFASDISNKDIPAKRENPLSLKNIYSKYK